MNWKFSSSNGDSQQESNFETLSMFDALTSTSTTLSSDWEDVMISSHRRSSTNNNDINTTSRHAISHHQDSYSSPNYFYSTQRYQDRQQQEEPTRPGISRYNSVPGHRFHLDQQQDQEQHQASIIHETTPTESRTSSATPRRHTITSSTSPPIISSCLHDAARICNWTEVIQLAQSQPYLAQYLGKEQGMALHHACSRRPKNARVVELLLKAYPDALLCQDNKGWNPLHYACRFKASLEVFQLLLQLYPNRARKAMQMTEDENHRKPLFFAVRYDAPEGVLEKLLDVDASSILEMDRKGESPLSRLWTNYNEMPIGKQMVEKMKQKVLRGEVIHLKSNTPFEKVWNKIEFLLWYAWKRKYKTLTKKDWKVVHAICSIQCHLTVFYISIGLYPTQIHETHVATGRTALHCASMSPAIGEGALTVISYILEKYEVAAQCLDLIEGCLPLHLIVQNGYKYHWILHGAQDIYNAYPSALSTMDSNGRYPLHHACKSLSQIYKTIQYTKRNIDESTSVIQQLVSLHISAATVQDKFGQYPIHILCSHAVYWDDDVQSIFEAYPNALHQRDHSGRLPIHYAAANAHASSDLMEILLQHHPRSATIGDQDGKLPLHLACGVGIGILPESYDRAQGGKIVMRKLQSLFQTYPSALNIPDSTDRRWTPLHHACASPGKENCNIIQQLLLLGEELGIVNEMAEQKDTHGRYPLHLACASGKRWKGGVKQLFEIFPLACMTVDQFGILPWQGAALSGKDVQVHLDMEEEEEEEEEMDVLEKEMALDKINTLFELLICDPTTVKSYGPDIFDQELG